MLKLKRKELSQDEIQAMRQATSQQTGRIKFERTTDGSKVFTTPIQTKVLVYVPNHTMQDAEGNTILRMDMPFLHKVTQGNSVSMVRCTAGLSELGYDSCPLCEETQYHWDLANLKIKNECEAKGLNPEDTESKEVRDIRSKHYGDRKLDNANRRLIFPIVVINTKEKDEKGMPKAEPMWYSISEIFFKKTWGAGIKASNTSLDDFDAAEADDENGASLAELNPAGKLFVLDFTYDAKGKQPTRMQSALNLTVLPKDLGAFEKLAPKWDAMTVDWTPEKCATTVVDALFYDEESLRELADSVTAPVKDMIAVYESKQAAPIGANVNVAIDGGTATPEISGGLEEIEVDELDEFDDFGI